MFSGFYYKRKLKQYLSHRSVQRSFLNLKMVKNLIVAVECDRVEDFQEIKKVIEPLIKNIDFRFVCFLNMKQDEAVVEVVGAGNVVLFRDDMTNKRTPKADAIERVDALEADVFVNLNREQSYVIDFLSMISKAKMRVGFEEKKEAVDLMIAVSKEQGYKPFFEKMFHLMGQINR